MTFDAPGGQLSYQRRGAGPLVVCLPGGPGMDPEAYFAGMDLPAFELLVYAPRGTGASAEPATRDGYLTSAYVADLAALRAHLGVERLTLYGNSHGGLLALAYAAAHPDRVERFVMTNAPAKMDDGYRAAAAATAARFADVVPDGRARLDAATAADQALDAATDEAEKRRHFRTLMARYVVREGPAETTYLDRLCAAPMNWAPAEVMYDEILDGLDLLAEADRVTAPALIVAGELDVTVPPAAMREIADALPRARYLELAGVGHFVEVEAAAEFSAAVTEFLTA
jgi:pimeloyl-ACP methyl ester carboxylesterase